MELSAYISLALATLVLMIKPGPLVMTYISLAMAGKWKSILSFWAGYALFIGIAYAFFLSTLTLLPPGFGIVFLFIKSIASMMFISLGIHGLIKASSHASSLHSSNTIEGKISDDNHIKNFFTGGVLSLSNPYDYIFVLTVVPSIVGTNSFSPFEIAMIILITSLGHIIVNGGYILPVMIFRKFLKPNMVKIINTVSSGLMILIGLYIFSTMFLRTGLEDGGLLSMIQGIYA